MTKDLSQSNLSVRNADGLDIGALLEMALQNMGCSRERSVQYSFVIDEALHVWRARLNPEATLRFHRRNLLTDVEFVFEIEGAAVNPLKVDGASRNDDIGNQMVDRLMAGVGGELRYRYRRGTNCLRLKLPRKNAERTLFLRNLLVLGLPIALQQLLEIASGCVDSFMLGFLDPVSMSSVSLAASYSAIPMLTISALVVASLTLISQYWGVRDRKGVSSSAAILMELAMIASFFYGLVTFFFPERIMSFYTNSPDVIAGGVSYLRVVALSFLVAPLYRLPYSFLRILGKPALSMNFAALGFVANVIFNLTFIFGLGPCPRLGTFGAGLATLLSGLVQVIIVAVYFHRHPLGILPELRWLRFSDEMLRKVVSVAFPVVMQFLVWIVGMNVISGAFGHMDKAILAANAALSNVYSLMNGISSGIAVAAGVMMGGVLGRGRFALAKESGETLMFLGRRLGVALAMLFAVSGYLLRFVLSSLTPEIIHWMNLMIVFFAINEYFHMQNGFLTEGTLYVGGDSKGVLIVDLASLWGLLVPVSIVGTYWPQAIPVLVMLAVLRLDEAISWPFKYLRYRTGRWIRSVTGHRAPA